PACGCSPGAACGSRPWTRPSPMPARSSSSTSGSRTTRCPPRATASAPCSTLPPAWPATYRAAPAAGAGASTTSPSSRCGPTTPALFGAGLIDAIPERDILAGEKAQKVRWAMAPADGDDAPVGRALRLPGGRIGRFGWKGQTASLSDFVQAACANELGLGNPGQAQPRPLGKPDYQAPGLDLTLEQCNQLTAYVASLPRPAEQLPREHPARDHAQAGRKPFGS